MGKIKLRICMNLHEFASISIKNHNTFGAAFLMEDLGKLNFGGYNNG